MARPVGAKVKPKNLLDMEWAYAHLDEKPEKVKDAGRRKMLELANDDYKNFVRELVKQQEAWDVKYEKIKEKRAQGQTDEGTERLEELIEEILERCGNA